MAEKVLAAISTDDVATQKRQLIAIVTNLKDVKDRVRRLESDTPNGFDKIVKAIKAIERDVDALSKSSASDLKSAETKLISRIRDAESKLAVEIQKQNGKRDEKISKELQAVKGIVADLKGEISTVKASRAMMKDGADGRGISSVFLRDNEVIVKFSDGSEESAGKIEVPKANDYFKNYGAFNRGRPGKSVEMYYETTDPTSSDGNDGALWVKYTE